MLKIKHQKKDPFVPPISISALFNLSCFLHNKNVAIDQNEFRITRKQIKHDKKILVRALLALGIKKGDIITKVDDISVDSIDELVNNIKDISSVKLTLKRDNLEFTTILSLINENSISKTGLLC